MESKNNECNILEVKSFSEQFLFINLVLLSVPFFFFRSCRRYTCILLPLLIMLYSVVASETIAEKYIYGNIHVRFIFFRPSEKAFLSYFSRPSIFNTFLLYPYCGDDVGFKNKYIFFPTKQEQNNREVLSEVTTVDLSIYFHRI